MERTTEKYACSYCQTAGSFKGEISLIPKKCPTLTHQEITKDVTVYRDKSRYNMMAVADQTPFTEQRVLRNRLEELIYFAEKLGYKRVGVAFCVSLMKEAQKLAKLLEDNNLSAVPVCCRVGAVDYNEIGLPKAHPDKFAAICNPVAQAKLLDLANVDLVVQVGLCMGHDIILQQTCSVPVTTLVVKDRVLDHHTVLALRSDL